MGKKPTRCDLCEFLLFYAVIFGSPSSKIKIFASKGNEYLKHFNVNEKFILLKNSSDRIGLEYFITTRIGFGLDNFGSDRILNISQLSDYKRPIRSDAHL